MQGFPGYGGGIPGGFSGGIGGNPDLVPGGGAFRPNPNLMVPGSGGMGGMYVGPNSEIFGNGPNRGGIP